MNAVPDAARRPHIAMIVVRGEAVRNFLYSDVLRHLSREARVTVLTVISEPGFFDPVREYIDRIVLLREVKERTFVVLFRKLVHDAHFRWLWSKVARNSWETGDARAAATGTVLRWKLRKALYRVLAFRPLVNLLGKMEEAITWHFRPTREFDELFKELKPELVFNTSHIHGQAGELPAKIAHRLGIPLAGFVFSWDNLTSRSRIFVPYDHYLVWHDHMRRQLLDIYPQIPAGRVHVTGTPQFDFHFMPSKVLPREELCRRLGIDAGRPFILWTTGITWHFPGEQHHIRFVIDALDKLGLPNKPQLVVRMYVKGLAEDMIEFSKSRFADVVFPEVGWDLRWSTPRYEDLTIYTSLLSHAAMCINPASTVTLEAIIHDKPVMNIGFDPPECTLPWHDRWVRHIEFDHFKPVADSGAVMVAYSRDDMLEMLKRGLTDPGAQSGRRKAFIDSFFDGKLDGRAGERVASALMGIVERGTFNV